MTETELTTELKTGTLGGIYFFYGEEDYMKNYRLAEIKRAVFAEADGMEDFNTFSFVFGEGECDLGAIADAFLAPPMMVEKKFISIFFSSLDSVKEKNDLFHILKENADNDTAVAVVSVTGSGFDAGTEKKPSPLLKTAMESLKCVNFPYQTDAKLARWMERHFAGYGLSTDSRAVRLLLDACGRSMYALSGEIAKVGAYAASHGKTAVEPDDIEACVVRTDSDDAFALANCVMNGDTSEALSCLRVKMNRREDPILVLSQITRTFTDLAAARTFLDDGRDKLDYAKSMKMNEYRAGLYYRAAGGVSTDFLARAMELCVEADRGIKSGVAGYQSIERLICRAAGRTK